MIAKDGKALTLLDLERGQAQIIYDIPFEGVYCGDNTLLQYSNADGSG